MCRSQNCQAGSSATAAEGNVMTMTDLEFEIGEACRDRESRRIQWGVEGATHHFTGPFEFGNYVERYDGPLDDGRMPTNTQEQDWTPLIYEAQDFEDAKELHDRNIRDDGPHSPYRYSRIVRRAVSPWEVFRD